jgi:hypothetical protein
VAKNGYGHSMMVEQGLMPIYAYIDDPSGYHHSVINSLLHQGTSFLGKLVSGKIVGPVWFGLLGWPNEAQGFLYGKLDKKKEFTGDDLAYIYPDYLTALYGKFEKKFMKSARLSKVVRVSCFDDILIPEFERPIESSPSYFFDQVSKFSKFLQFITDNFEIS